MLLARCGLNIYLRVAISVTGLALEYYTVVFNGEARDALTQCSQCGTYTYPIRIQSYSEAANNILHCNRFYSLMLAASVAVLRLRSLESLWILKNRVKTLFHLTHLISHPEYPYKIQPDPCTSSSVVTLARPSVSSSLQLTNRSFGYASPYLWNQLPSALLFQLFIPSTSLCSLSSWFTSSCAYHLITVTTFSLTIYHSLGLSIQI